MSADKPTANWDKLGSSFYRKVTLYTAVFDSDLELESHIIAGAPLSGAIAFAKQEDKLTAYRASQTIQGTINIYSCSGKQIKSLSWENCRVRGLGWSEEENLIVVNEDGNFRRYDGLSGDFVPFFLGHGADTHGVLSCRFWSHGFVALLGNNQLISVTSYFEPRPKLLASPPNEEVFDWTVIPPTDSLSRSVEVLLAIGVSLFLADASDCEDRGLDAGPFRHVNISPNGKFVALFTEDGKVWVITSDFQNRLSQYDTKIKTVPKVLHWCGNDAVALAWEDEVHLVGSQGESCKFYYDGWVSLLPDMDGIRLITNDVSEFLQRVPAATVQIFKPGSTSPASILLDAVDHLERKSPKADDNIQLIRQNLDEAVDTCIQAASHEYNIHWQKQLLKAASFGKSVLEFYSSDDFVDMTETLRVLNAVRFHSVGLPISYDQYLRLTPERLVQRLLSRHEYLLGLKISEYLSLPTDRVYAHWASRKVKTSTDTDESISRTVIKRLKGKKGVSFEEIARAAFDEGRVRLATDLLNHEPRAGKQVPLLLSMKEETVALDKAVQSDDTDLIYHVLSHLRKKLPLASFFRLINTRPLTTALVESNAWESEPSLLRDLYYQDDRRLDSAHLLLSEALDASDNLHRLEKIKMGTKVLHDSRDSAFTLKAFNETDTLLREQELIEKDFGLGFLGLSINQTLFKLIHQGGLKRATRLAALSDFKVPDRTFWWVKLRALVARRDWTEIEEVAKNRRNPINWEPFYNEVLAAGNLRLASIFVPKCTNQSTAERVQMWVKCNMVGKAAEEAGKAKDLQTLMDLRTKAQDQDAQEVERWISFVQKK